MHRILNKTAPIFREGPRFLSPRIRSFLRGFLRSGVTSLLVAVLAGSALAETYSIQIGLFRVLENARLQYTSVYNALSESQRGSLRIEKSGTLYAVRIGRFETQAQAEALLPVIKSVSPEAYIRKGDALPAEILDIKKSFPATRPVPPAKVKPADSGPPKTEEKSSRKVMPPVSPGEEGSLPGPSPRSQSPSATGKISVKINDPSALETSTPSETAQPNAAIPANRAWVWGSIREISPLPPEQLGLKSGKEIFRLILQVEETRKIAGYPNLLAEKEGDLLTVFTESKLTSYRVGDRVKALVEYRGNRYSRFFWIIKTEAPTR